MFEPLFNLISAVSDCPEPEQNRLKQHLKLNQYQSKEVIFKQNEDPSEIHLVTKGIIKTFFEDSEGEERTKGFCWEGRFCAPYASFLRDEPSSFSAMALEKTETISFSGKILRQLYQSHHCWDRLGRKVCEQLFVEREDRIYTQLTLDATARYHSFNDEYRVILNRIPLYEIASYIGITPVALSQIRRKAIR